MNYSNEELTTNEIENRELLFSFYTELMEEIKNTQFETKTDKEAVSFLSSDKVYHISKHPNCI